MRLRRAFAPTDIAGTTEFPFALLMSAAESEKERFSNELPGVSTVPGDLGGSGLYRDVCLCNANNFFGLRSCDCSLIVLSIRLVWSRERRKEVEEDEIEKGKEKIRVFLNIHWYTSWYIEKVFVVSLILKQIFIL